LFGVSQSPKVDTLTKNPVTDRSFTWSRKTMGLSASYHHSTVTRFLTRFLSLICTICGKHTTQITLAEFTNQWKIGPSRRYAAVKRPLRRFDPSRRQPTR
jgi:hypothetical protein